MSVPIAALLKPKFRGPWDSISAPSGTTLAQFSHPRGPLGALWELFGDGVEFCQVSGKSASTLWGPFWDPKSNKTEKRCPENSVEKKCSQSSPETAQCVICTIKTTCFEGSRDIRSGGFWSHFGSLSGSLLDTFSENTVIEEVKKTDNKKTSTFNEKGSRG